MVREIIEALFSAKETVSEALDNIEREMETVDRSTSELQVALAELGMNSEITEEQVELLQNAISGLDRSADSANFSIDRVRTTLNEYSSASELSEQQTEQLANSLNNIIDSSFGASLSLDDVQDELGQLAASGAISTEALERMARALRDVSGDALESGAGVSTLGGMMSSTNIAAKGLSSAIDEVNDELGQLVGTSTAASGSLGVLGRVSQETAFSFGSLSVNIGPFNVALKQALIQIPAILVGMGSLLAVVLSLATAFLTLAGAMGAFLAGGAVGFLEEHSEQFEDTAEAVEAMMGALIDLFKQAIQPLVNESNIQLFIDTIEGTARVVNRLAQAFDQMRDTVIGFGSDITGDFDEWMTAMERTLVILEPIIVDMINFFTKRGPDAIVFFASVTRDLAEPVGQLFDSFRRLFVSLLEFSRVVVGGVAPAVSLIIDVLSDFFTIVNAIPDPILKAAITGAVLSAFFLRGASLARSFVGALAQVHIGLVANAAAGGMLSGSLALISARFKVARNSSLSYTAAAKFAGKQMVTLVRQLFTVAKAQFTSAASSGILSAALIAQAAAWVVAQVAAAPVLPVLIAASAIAIALGGALAFATGRIGDFGGVMSSITPIIDGLKSVLMFLIDFILAALTPTMNLLITIFEAFISTIVAFVDGIMMVVDALGITQDAGEGAGGMLSQLRELALKLVSGLQPGIKIFRFFIELIGDLLAAGLTAWFRLVALVIGKVVSKMRQLGRASGFFQFLSTVLEGISNLLDRVGEKIDDFIEKVNKIPSVDIGGPAIDATEAREQLSGEREQEAGEDIETEPSAEFNFEESLEQNIEVDADPEQTEQMRRVVKDALNEANTIARRQQGHPG